SAVDRWFPPARNPVVQAYANETCSTVRDVVAHGACAPPEDVAYTLSGPQSGCSGYQFYASGDPVVAYYTASSPTIPVRTCAAGIPAAGVTSSEAIAIDAASFAPAIERHAGSGQARLFEWATADGPSVYDDGFYDTNL